MKKQTIVLGLGNPLMADEGIGVYLLDCLSKLSDKYPDVEFIDAGTGGLSLLHYFEGKNKAVIIDCANISGRAGDIKRFTPSQVESVKQLTHQSLHEQDLLGIIKMAQTLGQCPQEIVIFGIQPDNVFLKQELSPKLAERIDEYIAIICDELEK